VSLKRERNIHTGTPEKTKKTFPPEDFFRGGGRNLYLYNLMRYNLSFPPPPSWVVVTTTTTTLIFIFCFSLERERERELDHLLLYNGLFNLHM
jgi:hypothetical protein